MSNSSLTDKNPQWVLFQPDWQQMRDTARGQRVVKEAGVRYLPMTASMIADGDEGKRVYAAYKVRAVYPDYVKEAVDALLGVMHRKPPTIELPGAMADMIDRATLQDESLEMVLQQINEQQLITGRLGLFADVDTSEDRAGRPYLALYHGERITNWDTAEMGRQTGEELQMVVLDETDQKREPNSFTWKREQQHRVLLLGELDNSDEPDQVYTAGVFDEHTGFSAEQMEAPMIAGNMANEIPFVFINAVDVVAEPQNPPLLGLSDSCLTIYRGEADYRQALFMQGQDTLVIIGANDDKGEVRTGAGQRINLPAGQGIDAKYIGVDSSGLPEMRQGLENDHNRALQKAGQLLDTVSRERESGEALHVRVAARTATLHRVVAAGAWGLQSLLRKVATWMGANPDEVVVTPNTDFVPDEMPGSNLVDLMRAKKEGAPISLESIHALMARRGLTEKAFDEETVLVEQDREEAAERAQETADMLAMQETPPPVERNGSPPIQEPTT